MTLVFAVVVPAAAARLFLFRPVLEVRGGMVGLELLLVDDVVILGDVADDMAW